MEKIKTSNRVLYITPIDVRTINDLLQLIIGKTLTKKESCYRLFEKKEL